MADNTRTSFEKMGTVNANAVNQSALGTTNTKLAAKKGGSGGTAEPATASHRQAALERNGFKGAPQTTLYVANAPEASATFRNVRIFPSAIGNRDFYLRRQYNQGL